MYDELCLVILLKAHTQIYKAICDNYNMGTSALLDMHARIPRAEGIHVRQSMSARVTTNMIHFWHSQNLPKS